MAVLVGKPAPDFTAAAVMGNNSIENKFNFYNSTKGKYTVVFFYPMDFTFVCPTEIIAFSNRLQEFRDRRTEVIAISGDSEYTHLAWKNTPVDKGGVGQLQFPMVADITRSIARSYDVLLDDAVALRGTFLIDRDHVVRHQLVNDLPLGRDIDETLRMVDALQFFEEHGEVCPAGWSAGKSGMKASTSGVAEYLSGHGKNL